MDDWHNSFAWLAHMGWWADDRVMKHDDGRLTWVVEGTNGDSGIETKGVTRAKAWAEARRQAAEVMGSGARKIASLSDRWQAPEEA